MSKGSRLDRCTPWQVEVDNVLWHSISVAPEFIVDCLERMNIGILFMVGGDGTLRASKKIAEEIEQRNLKISIIGIPKTIDNDIYLVSRSFGFDTAVDVATDAIKGAHNEASAYPNGIGLIKLMGRHSGFLAATAALAQPDANFVLVPEVDIFLFTIAYHID